MKDSTSTQWCLSLGVKKQKKTTYFLTRSDVRQTPASPRVIYTTSIQDDLVQTPYELWTYVSRTQPMGAGGVGQGCIGKTFHAISLFKSSALG